MERILTIDRGNTAVKIEMWTGSVLSARANVPASEGVGAQTIALDKFLYANGHPEGAICSSTVGYDDAFAAELRGLCPGVIELNAFTPMPLAIDYSTPATLGPDRIAAAVGARTVEPLGWLLVVDIGTAVTYDLVSDDNRFCGGNIAPGPIMRLQALHHFTRALPEVDVRGDVPAWGLDTVGAMRAGSLRGIAAEIEYYSRRLPEECTIVLTGGGAELVNYLTDCPHTVAEGLVTKGLLRILKYNEDK